MFSLLIGAALAVEGSVGIGLEGTWNDPFVNTVGARLSAELSPFPWLRAGVAGGVYPLAGEQSWTDLTRQLHDQHNLAVELSHMLGRGMGEVTWVPLRTTSDGPRGRWEESLGLTVGLGGVLTQDDHETLGVTQGTNQSYDTHAREWHPASVLGVVGEVRCERWGVRLRMERLRYVEVVLDIVQEEKAPLWVGAEYAWYPGAR